jgi:predicted AlkP superfamily phosphohydrolase/phosphomutase
MKSSLARLGLGRERLGWLASRLGLSRLSGRIPGRVKGAFPRTRFSFDNLAGHVDWPGTRAYFLSSSEGSLYANIRGREPSGCLTETQAESLLGEMKGALLEEKDPGTGRKLLEAVFSRDEIYHGKYVLSSPDLLLLPAEGYYFSESGLGPLVGDQGVEKHQISATHHPEGAVIVSGGPFARGAGKQAGPRIWDVTPTLLYALGMDIPGDLDGRVLEEFIDGRHLEKNPVSYGESLETLSAEGGRGLGEREVKKIISNLESLGYY